MFILKLMTATRFKKGLALQVNTGELVAGDSIKTRYGRRLLQSFTSIRDEEPNENVQIKSNKDKTGSPEFFRAGRTLQYMFSGCKLQGCFTIQLQ